MAVHTTRYSVIHEARSNSSAREDRALATAVIIARVAILAGLLALVVFALD